MLGGNFFFCRQCAVLLEPSFIHISKTLVTHIDKQGTNPSLVIDRIHSFFTLLNQASRFNSLLPLLHVVRQAARWHGAWTCNTPTLPFTYIWIAGWHCRSSNSVTIPCAVNLYPYQTIFRYQPSKKGGQSHPYSRHPFSRHTCIQHQHATHLTAIQSYAFFTRPE